MIAWQTNDSITKKWNSPCSFLFYFCCSLQCFRRVRADFLGFADIDLVSGVLRAFHSNTAPALDAFIICSRCLYFMALLPNLLSFGILFLCTSQKWSGVCIPWRNSSFNFFRHAILLCSAWWPQYIGDYYKIDENISVYKHLKSEHCLYQGLTVL